jgi:hypothetical protein
MDRPHDAENAASRERLRAVAASLGPEDLALDLGDGWTPATLLLHLAYWDGFVAARWRQALAGGRDLPVDLPDALADMVNAALAPILAGVGAEAAATIALAAAEEADAVVRGLPERAVAAASSPDRNRLVDRSLHREDHLARIEAALRRR